MESTITALATTPQDNAAPSPKRRKRGAGWRQHAAAVWSPEAAALDRVEAIPGPEVREKYGAIDVTLDLESLGFALDALFDQAGDIPESAPLLMKAESGGVWLETKTETHRARRRLDADVVSGGMAVVDGARLWRALMCRDGLIRLRENVEERRLEVPAPAGAHLLRTWSQSTWPAHQHLAPVITPLELSAEGLATALGGVAVVMTAEDDCVVLGDRNGQIWATACDGGAGFAATARWINSDIARLPYGLALPRASVLRLWRLLTGERVHVSVGHDRAMFVGDGWSLESQLIRPLPLSANAAGWILDEDQIQTRAAMSRPALLDAVRQASQIGSHWLSVRLWGGMLTLESEVGAEHTGDRSRFLVETDGLSGVERAAALDAGQLRDALEASDSDMVTLQYTCDRALLSFHDAEPGDRPDAPLFAIDLS